MKSLEKRSKTFYKATCANVRAVERALEDLDAGYGANEISLLVSATRSHSKKNLNRTRGEQWENIEEMARAAKGRFRLVGTVSVAFGCPFEGKVDPDSVLKDVEKFASLGVTHVALGDTIGTATPASVRALFSNLKGVTPIAHFHDSRGTGLVNYVAAYEAGVRWFDASFGGVGGHPAKVKYGDGFTGNVCTEDLVNLFESMGISTGINLDGLLATAEFCEQTLGRELHGRVTRSGLTPFR
jgi:hydroxymethylglutaryl-CoA lyase